jgi:ribonuclease Z
MINNSSSKQVAPHAIWRVWDDHPALTIPGTSYTLIGYSVAALRTNFYIRELGVMLDAGISANICPDHILITHGHSDHTANLPFHLYGQKEGRKIQVYVPNESVEYFRSFVTSSYELTSGHSYDQKSPSGYDLVGVSPNQALNITINKRPWKLDIIKCDHGLPCVGYGLSEGRTKLKQEYVGLSGKEIGALRKSGIEVSVEIEIPIMLFLGDTSRDILREEKLERYPVIMMECTFIDPEDEANAEKTKHMHWSHLSPYISKHPNTTFILYHFSQRYKPSEIKAHFDKVAMTNVVPWISE